MPEGNTIHRFARRHARDLAGHRLLGATARGTPVHIDRRFLDSLDVLCCRYQGG
jgi:nickel-dependent lactate racemase